MLKGSFTMPRTAWLSDRAFTLYRMGSGAHALLDGTGAAARDDARWNSRGRQIIYAAEHYATALLERAAQLNSIRIPRSFVYIEITVPAGVPVEVVDEHDVPGWDAEDKTASQRFGDQWHDERQSLVLLVPSLVAPGLERNALINPSHPLFRRIRASPARPVRSHPRLLI